MSKKLKEILRFVILCGLILLASMGMVPVTFNTREKYMDKAVQIEQVDTAEDDKSEISLEEKK